MREILAGAEWACPAWTVSSRPSSRSGLFASLNPRLVRSKLPGPHGLPWGSGSHPASQIPSSGQPWRRQSPLGIGPARRMLCSGSPGWPGCPWPSWPGCNSGPRPRATSGPRGISPGRSPAPLRACRAVSALPGTSGWPLRGGPAVQFQPVGDGTAGLSRELVSGCDSGCWLGVFRIKRLDGRHGATGQYQQGTHGDGNERLHRGDVKVLLPGINAGMVPSEIS